MDSNVSAAPTINNMNKHTRKPSHKHFRQSVKDMLSHNPWAEYSIELWSNDIRPAVVMACKKRFYLTIGVVRSVSNFLDAQSWLYLVFTVLLAWLHPGVALKLLQYCMMGTVGHLVLGMGSLRWFEQYRNETIPLVKIFGFELTVRNGANDKPGMMNRMFVNAFRSVKDAFQKKKQVRSLDSQAPYPQLDSIVSGPINVEQIAVALQVGNKHELNFAASGLYLTPVYIKGIENTTERPSSGTLRHRIGLLFIQDGLLNMFEQRQLLLHIQITKAFLDRTDGLIHDLTALLADLTPPSISAAPMAHLCIANKHNLEALAKQIRQLLYKGTDKKHFDHAWWHDSNFPSTLTAMDIEELSTWVKVCLHMLVVKKRVKLQSVLDEAYAKLVKELLKTGLSPKKPRNRKERLNEGLPMQKTEVAQGQWKKPKGKQAVDAANYSGIAGDLAGLGEAGIVNVNLW